MAETHTSVAPEVDWMACSENITNPSWTAVKEGTAGPITLSPISSAPENTLQATVDAIMIRETLLSFDLSAIPSDATIISVTLTLDVAWARPNVFGSYVSRVTGQIDPTWSSGVVTIADWRKASYLVTRPLCFVVTTYSLSLIVGQTIDIPFTNLTGMFTGGTLGIVLAEVTQATNWWEPPATIYSIGVGAAFYSVAASGRTPPTLTVVHKDGTYDPGDPEATGRTGGLIMGANF